MGEYCQGQIHFSDDGRMLDETDAVKLVEFTGQKFGGTEEKALCQHCIDLLSKHSAEVVILKISELEV